MSARLQYQASGPTVQVEPMREFAAGLLRAAGAPRDDAEFVAETLIHADLRGVHSHGVRLLNGYVSGLLEGIINPRPDLREVAGGPGHAVFDGDRSLGQVSARVAMQRAIELARNHGVGVTVVREGGHFGAAAYWALMAADGGCIGYCTSNMAGAVMLAHGSRQGATGNIPLAWAFPTGEARPVVLDMACGVAAVGKVTVIGLGGGCLPEGVAADAEGRPTRDPAQARLVHPAGGAKGYALAVAHDILSGGLSGGGMTIHKPRWSAGQPHQGTLFFLAIDIAAIMPLDGFAEAMDAQVRAVNALPPAEGFERVYMPGQIEWESFAEREASGIPFPPGGLEALQPLGERLGVAWPWSAA